MSVRPEIIRRARALATNGISVMPVDGRTKRPYAGYEWKHLQTTALTPDEVERDIVRLNADAIAVIAGRVSGGLLVIDFDLPEFWARWMGDVEQRGQGLPMQRTGGGGYQAFLRCDEPGGNAKLAWAKSDTEPSGREIAIETRGEGGYALVPPSSHPSGNFYVMEPNSPLLSKPPHIDAETVAFLLQCARDLDEAPQPKPAGDAPPAGVNPDRRVEQQERPRNGRAPGTSSVAIIEAFNQASDVATILRKHGYTILANGTFRRPGKDKGTSGKIVRDPDGVERAVHFSSNDPQNDGKFGNGLCGRHSAFDLFAQFEHGGSFKKATAAAAGLGFGGEPPRTSSRSSGPARAAAKPDAPVATDEAAGDDVADSGGGDGGRDGPARLGERDADGVLYLSPRRTMPTAKAFVRDHYTYADPTVRTLHFYNDALWAWANNRYEQIDEVDLRSKLYPYLHHALAYYKDRSGEIVTTEFPANHATVESAVKAISDNVNLETKRAAPFFIEPDLRYPQSVEPEHLIPCASFNFHVNTGERLPPTPALFAMSSIDFDPEPDAREPTAWLNFLSQLWPNDPDQVQTLQEFMGYLLTPDTRHQKALMIVGPRRAGKGTIIRTIERLVGKSNVAGLTPSLFASQFGLQPLIGKTVATIPDARFHGEGVNTITDRLLSIIGEDTLTIDRKNRDPITVRLPARFVLMTNELPKFQDASAALVGRFVILNLEHSFYGREDLNLGYRIEAELPGIFLWAVEGLKRLRDRGRFVQPASGAESVRELEEAASPVIAFVRERCEIGDTGDHWVWCDALYGAFQAWWTETGRGKAPSVSTFGRNFSSAFPGHGAKQDKATRGKRFYPRIRVKQTEGGAAWWNASGE